MIWYLAQTRHTIYLDQELPRPPCPRPYEKSHTVPEMKVSPNLCLLGCHLLAWLVLSQGEVLDAKSPVFTIEDDVFKLDGKFFRILSGR